MSSPSSAATQSSTTTALITSNAPTLSPLIATAINVASIKTHVTVTLSQKAAYYTKWQTYFRAACGKFGLASHIDGSVDARPDDPAWLQADDCVHTWLYNSVADDIIDSVIANRQYARDLWLRIGELFTANHNTRAVYLRHEFHSIVQGELPVTEYMQRVKVLTKALHNAGSTVRDDEIVLNTLRGLSPRLQGVAYPITFFKICCHPSRSAPTC